MAKIRFFPRQSVEDIEEGCVLAPKFCPDGLMPCITTVAESGEALILGWMNTNAPHPIQL